MRDSPLINKISGRSSNFQISAAIVAKSDPGFESSLPTNLGISGFYFLSSHPDVISWLCRRHLLLHVIPSKIRCMSTVECSSTNFQANHQIFKFFRARQTFFGRRNAKNLAKRRRPRPEFVETAFHRRQRALLAAGEERFGLWRSASSTERHFSRRHATQRAER